MAKTLLTQIKLRRDNDYNYEAKKTTFVPLKGEVCLVDVAGQGLKAKVGDGATTWENLYYTDEQIYAAIDAVVQRGYYYDGTFYSDSTHTKPITASLETIYIEASTGNLYIYNGSKYVTPNDNLPAANASAPGIMKLYTELGNNTDGTIDQKTLTTILNKKVSAVIDSTDQELLIFSTN